MISLYYTICICICIWYVKPTKTYECKQKWKENLIDLQTLYLMWIIHEHTYTLTHTHIYIYLKRPNLNIFRTSFTFYTQSSCLINSLFYFYSFEPFRHHCLFLPHPSLALWWDRRERKAPKLTIQIYDYHFQCGSSTKHITIIII